MLIFIEGVDRGIRNIVKESSFVPTHEVNGVVVNKHKDNWTKEEIEKVQCDFKAKMIIIVALCLDEFLRVSHYGI